MYNACLFPIKVKTAEPIDPKIFEATHMTLKNDDQLLNKFYNKELLFFKID